MLVTEIRHTLELRRRRSPVRFALRAFDPATGEAIGAMFATIEAALGRGAELMEGGYCFEIWSPAWLEERARG